MNPKLADGASEEVETILDREIELRIFRPENQTNKAGIMYYHGGGFVMCHVKMYRKFLTNLGKITWVRSKVVGPIGPKWTVMDKTGRPWAKVDHFCSFGPSSLTPLDSPPWTKIVQFRVDPITLLTRPQITVTVQQTIQGQSYFVSIIERRQSIHFRPDNWTCLIQHFIYFKMRPNMVLIQMKLSLLVILLVDFFQSIVGIDFTFQIIVFDRKEYRFCIQPLVIP